MADNLLISVFIVVGALVLWGNGLYLLFLYSFVSARPRRVPKTSPPATPTVTAVVRAHNEETTIGARIENLLALDYPRDKLEIIVASDGSTDATNDLVRIYGTCGVRLLASVIQRGSAAASTEAVREVTSEWVLFTDAETRMEPSFLRKLTPHFGDPKVGVVDGALVCANAESTAIAHGVGLYWKYESKLKQLESEAGCLASTFGACTAVRTSIFRPLDETEDVDFTTPLDAIADGYRVVHEPTAVAFELTHPDLRTQFQARARMVTKNLPGTLRKLDLRLARRPHVVLSIVSHKLLRWFTPVLLLAALSLNASLAERPLFRVLLFAQLAFYFLGALGLVAWATKRQIPLASAVFSFLVANAGFLVGVVNSLRGVRIASWDPRHGRTGGRPSQVEKTREAR